MTDHLTNHSRINHVQRESNPFPKRHGWRFFFFLFCFDATFTFILWHFFTHDEFLAPIIRSFLDRLSALNVNEFLMGEDFFQEQLFLLKQSMKVMLLFFIGIQTFVLAYFAYTEKKNTVQVTWPKTYFKAYHALNIIGIPLIGLHFGLSPRILIFLLLGVFSYLFFKGLKK